MNFENPYQTPSSSIEQQPLHLKEDTEKSLLSAQDAFKNTLILFFTSPITFFLYYLGVVAFVTAIVLSIVGTNKLCDGLGYDGGSRTLYIAMMFVPIANIVFVFVLNARINRALQNNGYRIGMFTAKK